MTLFTPHTRSYTIQITTVTSPAFPPPILTVFISNIKLISFVLFIGITEKNQDLRQTVAFKVDKQEHGIQ